MEILRTKIADQDRKKLKTLLVRYMMAVIEILARVEKDRPGAAKLYERKLVSDQYWSELNEAMKMVNGLLEKIMAEAEFIEEGWGSKIFPQAIQFWRLEKMREARNEGDKE